MSPAYWILVFSTHLVLSRGEQCGGVAEEGEEHTLTCTLTRSNQSIHWELQTGASYETISSCDSAGSCTDLRSTSFQASLRKVTERTGNESYTGLLKIIRSNRTENRFRCVKTKDVQSEICELQVYVRAEVPKCQPPSLTKIETSLYLNVTCSSDRVFPKGGCNFTYKGLPSNLSVDVTTWHNPSSRSPGNYKIMCSWLAHVSDLDPRNVLVQVEVYPHLSTWVEAASAYSEWTYPFKENTSSVALASDCPAGPSVRSGYILANTLATCKCELRVSGYPPGYAQWYKNGSKIGTNEEDGSALLIIHYNDKGTTFTCQLESKFGLRQLNPQKISYSPKFAVGPSKLTIDMSDANPLCPTESLTYQVTCKVPIDDVIPQPLFTIIINNKTAEVNLTGKLDKTSNFYYLRHTFRPDFGGSHRVYCRVTNEIFSDQSFYDERPYIINEPPTQAPILKAHDNQPEPGSNIAYVTDGSNVHLTCTVDGGYPKVSNITIGCGNNWNTMQGPLATISVNIPNGSRILLCHCTAWHITGCYHKRTELVLSLEKPGNLNDTSNSSLSLGLGVGLGCIIILFIVAVIVFIVFYKRRGEQANGKSGDVGYSQPHFTSSPSYQYASFLPGQPAPSLPPPSSHQCQSDYDFITLDSDIAPVSSADRYSSRSTESSTDVNQDISVPEGYIQPI